MGFWGNFWDLIVFVFWLFAFTAYLFVLFMIIGDLIRDHKLNGWFKAIWLLFLFFVPVLTALVYLIARGRGMNERTRQRVERVRDDSYDSPLPVANPAGEIAKAQALVDAGTITPGEFDAIRNKALGNKF
jgi:hypothetical protein